MDESSLFGNIVTNGHAVNIDNLIFSVHREYARTMHFAKLYTWPTKAYTTGNILEV